MGTQPETLAYYDDGQDKFQNGQMIFLNHAVEGQQRHMHAHNYIEIAYVASGRGIHRINGRQFTVARGDLFVINYDVCHEFRSVPEYGAGSLEIYNCIFRPEFIDRSLIHSRCFSDISHVFLFRSLFEKGEAENDIRILGGDHPEIAELYEKMFREYRTHGYGYQEMLRAYLVELLVHIFRLCREGEPREAAAREQALFDRVVRFLQQHYSQDVRLDDLAAMTFLSRNYFCTRFRECTGMTVVEYLHKLRMEEACRLLRESNGRVIDVSQAVGYGDLKFFNSLFKKIVGCTPSQYRTRCPAGEPYRPT